ncbi:hypothetical protein AD951_03750 [Acetobacter malorum]|uniref:Uncharacterized protein n=1 Tax=Acetobacter malorum TaxID=178901 RepID=A0A149UQ72_9PROT|nr:hypothetical protein AD951_03750 [Acetobacter malorum]
MGQDPFFLVLADAINLQCSKVVGVPDISGSKDDLVDSVAKGQRAFRAALVPQHSKKLRNLCPIFSASSMRTQKIRGFKKRAVGLLFGGLSEQSFERIPVGSERVAKRLEYGARQREDHDDRDVFRH